MFDLPPPNPAQAVPPGPFKFSEGLLAWQSFPRICKRWIMKGNAVDPISHNVS